VRAWEGLRCRSYPLDGDSVVTTPTEAREPETILRKLAPDVRMSSEAGDASQWRRPMVADGLRRAVDG